MCVCVCVCVVVSVVVWDYVNKIVISVSIEFVTRMITSNKSTKSIIFLGLNLFLLTTDEPRDMAPQGKCPPHELSIYSYILVIL